MKTPNVLRLTLHKKAFEIMVTGEKTIEYRAPGKWIESRLYEVHPLLGSQQHRHYDLVEFTNGYGKDKPRFVAEYEGFRTMVSVLETYSNGLTVDAKLVYGIQLGKVLEIHNYSPPLVAVG